MIHSLSGGVLNTHGKHDYAKAKMLDGEKIGETLWFVSNLPELKIGDKVKVEGLSCDYATGEVIRIDRNVDEFSFPISYKRMKRIVEILK